MNDVKERFEAKDKSIELLQKELSELRRAKENEAQAAQRAEKLALEQSVKQRDAEIEQLRKQLSEDDPSTPRDRGALFALRRQLAGASRRDARRLRKDLEDLRRVRAARCGVAGSSKRFERRSESVRAPRRAVDQHEDLDGTAGGAEARRRHFEEGHRPDRKAFGRISDSIAQGDAARTAVGRELVCASRPEGGSARKRCAATAHSELVGRGVRSSTNSESGGLPRGERSDEDTPRTRSQKIA